MENDNTVLLKKDFREYTGEKMYSEIYQVRAADLAYYENGKMIDVRVDEYEDHFDLRTVVDGVEADAQAEDLFSAFRLLRDKLLEMAWGMKCNAARRNAVQSGMMRNTDAVYLVEWGKQAGREDVHGFWDYCDMECIY